MTSPARFVISGSFLGNGTPETDGDVDVVILEAKNDCGEGQSKNDGCVSPGESSVRLESSSESGRFRTWSEYVLDSAFFEGDVVMMLFSARVVSATLS